MSRILFVRPANRLRIAILGKTVPRYRAARFGAIYDTRSISRTHIAGVAVRPSQATHAFWVPVVSNSVRWCPWAKARAWWAVTCTGQWVQAWARTPLWWPSSLVSDGQGPDLKAAFSACYFELWYVALWRNRNTSNSGRFTRFTIVDRRASRLEPHASAEVAVAFSGGVGVYSCHAWP